MKKTAHFPTFSAVDAAQTCPYIKGTSLLCVSMAGREAGFAEPALAFWEKEGARWSFGPQPEQGSPSSGANGLIPKKRHPACAGCRAGDAITGGVKWKGVFGVGALLPQFLTELTSTLNSRIWEYDFISARPWQT